MTIDQPTEIWKDVPNFPGYQVSDNGRIRSFWKRIGNFPNWKWGVSATPIKILKGHADKRTGYVHVNLNRTARVVHQLVLEAFIGPRPTGSESVHKDGNPGNNRLNNLRWGSHSDNMKDRLRHRTHPSQLLTVGDVMDIRKMRSEGCSRKEIGSKYKITPEHISSITNKVRWGWL